MYLENLCLSVMLLLACMIVGLIGEIDLLDILDVSHFHKGLIHRLIAVLHLNTQPLSGLSFSSRLANFKSLGGLLKETALNKFISVWDYLLRPDTESGEFAY